MEEQGQNRVAETLRKITLAARKKGLTEFLLIGGNAVIAHGVPRFTRDVDFAIPERLVDEWRDFLESEGFPFAHGTEAFVQFHDAADTHPRVDLMVVDESTWANLFSKAEMTELVDGAPTFVALPEHLIAMKLRAVRSPHRRSGAQDWSDIVELACRKKLDPVEDRGFADLVLRFGGDELLQKLVDEIAKRTGAHGEE